MIRAERITGLCLLLLAGAATAFTPGGGAARARRLEDAGDYNGDDGANNNYAYMHTGTCFRMKISDNNGDDDGNSYFYNGAYRAQYSVYTAFQLCQDGSGDSCKTYVSNLEDYLQQTVPYVQELCNSCAQTCRRALRELENNNNGENENNNNQWQVDCSICSSQCQRLSKAQGTDEANYLECQNAGQSDDDMQYYTAPQCEDGALVIGQFYDDACTIKASKASTVDFGYATFGTVQDIAFDCSLSEETCAKLQENSVYCGDGSGEYSDNASLCRAAASASRVKSYHKKPFYKRIPIALITFLILAIGGAFLFLAYTYYVRHRVHKLIEAKHKTPMAELDGEPSMPELA